MHGAFSVMTSFNTGSDHELWKRIHIIPVVSMKVLNVSVRRSRPMQTDERKMLRQDEATNWTVVADTEEDYGSFAEKMLQYGESKVHILDGWIRGRSNEGTVRENRYKSYEKRIGSLLLECRRRRSTSTRNKRN